MHIQVDQSGKIEQLNKDTYIAFSNHEEYCIKFPKKIKGEIVYEYKAKVSQIIQRLFAVCVFYCLENYVSKKELITTDLEYPGWEADIKTYLIPLLRLKDKNFDTLENQRFSVPRNLKISRENKIQFNAVGKKSRAHKVAKSAFVGKSKPNRILTKEDVTKWLK